MCSPAIQTLHLSLNYSHQPVEPRNSKCSTGKKGKGEKKKEKKKLTSATEV